MRRGGLRALGVALAAALAGCGIGDGNGEVKGTLHITGCYGEGADLANQKEYDLHPAFFAGEPIDDPSGLRSVDQLRLRVQSSGASVENADALMVDVNDVAAVAQHVGEWMDIYAGGDATPASGVEVVGPVRVSLSLMRTCGLRFPDVGQFTLIADTDSAAGVSSRIRFTRLGRLNCVVDDDGGVHDCETTDGGPFSVGFGGTIRAEFELDLVDSRPSYLGPGYPALGAGHVRGYFEFTLRRGRVAQAFP